MITTQTSCIANIFSFSQSIFSLQDDDIDISLAFFFCRLRLTFNITFTMSGRWSKFSVGFRVSFDGYATAAAIAFEELFLLLSKLLAASLKAFYLKLRMYPMGKLHGVPKYKKKKNRREEKFRKNFKQKEIIMIRTFFVAHCFALFIDSRCCHAKSPKYYVRNIRINGLFYMNRTHIRAILDYNGSLQILWYVGCAKIEYCE